MGAEFWDDLGRKLSGAADKVGKKTSEVAGVAKLKNQIYAMEREMNAHYAEIGKKIYERYLEEQELDEDLKSLCETIAQKEIIIKQYEGEIEELKEKK